MPRVLKYILVFILVAGGEIGLLFATHELGRIHQSQETIKRAIKIEKKCNKNNPCYSEEDIAFILFDSTQQ